jgi:hypothetical protein
VELNEFQVLKRQASTSNHSVTVTSASVSRGSAEVSTTVTLQANNQIRDLKHFSIYNYTYTSGQNNVVGSESVNGTVFEAHSHNTTAFTVLHNEIHSEVLDEESAVVLQGLTHHSVQEGVTSTISSGAATNGLTSLTEVQALTTECTLVNGAISVTREGDTKVFQFNNCSRGFTTHVLNSVLVCILVSINALECLRDTYLISQPITTLDSVIRVPAPVVIAHVTQSSINTTLSSPR